MDYLVDSVDDAWMMLWRNVFEWLPWPLFVWNRFTEADYYRSDE